MEFIYPVGSIYMSVDSTNPAQIFGFGTWVAWGAGRVPVGVDTSQTEFDTVEEARDAVRFEAETGIKNAFRNENGETVILRPGSSDGAPTIERQVNGRKKTEIRYDD